MQARVVNLNGIVTYWMQTIGRLMLGDGGVVSVFYEQLARRPMLSTLVLTVPKVLSSLWSKPECELCRAVCEFGSARRFRMCV